MLMIGKAINHSFALSYVSNRNSVF